jgi:2-polyprenyl-3-methyl-5-hydroxy-6-metoxy-1,4-benzoquinol methylase
MNLIERNSCVVSGREDLELLYRFERFPVFMGCVEHAQAADVCAEMSWWISRSTGSLQLNPLIPIEVLYSQSHGAGSVGALWHRHHSEFAKFVSEHEPGCVLEIGGGHGILAQNCLQQTPDIQWTIVEPNPTIPPDSKIHVIRQLFDSQFIINEEVDTVVHSHLLEHIYEPFAFMAQLSRSLRQGKKHLFSVPHLKIMLERKYSNCINFEHTVFLTEQLIEYILQSNGFMITQKRYFLDDHSIFYATIRDDAATSIARLPNEYDRTRKVYMDYIHFHTDLINELNSKMSNQRGTIFLFGGHVFAQYLLAFGLDESSIQCILDNDAHKQGRRLYGSTLMVQSPRLLRTEAKPVVILRAGVYNSEIKEDILNNINPYVTFWE